MEDLVLGMLSSTTAHSELPLRVTTFQQRDTTSDKVRVNVVVSVGQSGTPPGEFALGYSLVNSRDVVVTSSTTKQFLGAGLAGNEPLSYGTAVLVDPGTYALRVGVVDSNGNRGSVIRAVDGTTIVENDLATSDLMIGHRPAAGQPLLPTVEPRITQGGLAAYLELYSPTAIDLDWTTVTFEIARGEDLPALSSEMADILPGAKPSWRVAFAVVPANELPPGRYIARARVERDGTTLSVLARPFVLDGAPSGRTELPPR
jgi:hypothetical protein